MESISSYGSAKVLSSVSESSSSSSSSSPEPACGLTPFRCPQPPAEFTSSGKCCTNGGYWLPTTLTNNEAYCTAQSAQWGGTVYCSNGGLYIIWLYPVVYCADGVLYFAPSSTDYPSNLRLVDGIVTGTASWEMLPGCIATIRFNGG